MSNRKLAPDADEAGRQSSPRAKGDASRADNMTVGPPSSGLMALQRMAGNRAVTRLLSVQREESTDDPATSDVPRSDEAAQEQDVPVAGPPVTPIAEAPAPGSSPGAAGPSAGDEQAETVQSLAVQRVEPTRPVEAAGLGIDAAGLVGDFYSYAKPDPQGSLLLTHTHFGIREGAAPAGPVREKDYSILLIDSNRDGPGQGKAWVWISIHLKFDGQNIIEGYTRKWSSNGYAGGLFGSAASANFSAVDATPPGGAVRTVSLVCHGSNDPAGPGYQTFFARFTVTGAGEGLANECSVTEGDGSTGTKPHAYSGWHKDRMGVS
jgi:hypothetical protein